MAKILGLDLGTNSIGWAVVDTLEKKIVDTEFRFFAEDMEQYPLKTTNLSRTEALK